MVTICYVRCSDFNTSFRMTHFCYKYLLFIIVSTILVNSIYLVHWAACATLPSVWKHRYSFPYGRSFILLVLLLLSNGCLTWTDTCWTLSEKLLVAWCWVALWFFIEVSKDCVLSSTWMSVSNLLVVFGIFFVSDPLLRLL